jgi:hypothetical protein
MSREKFKSTAMPTYSPEIYAWFYLKRYQEDATFGHRVYE